ncbi:Por secretion system C-terminal sorting domain-containing protein [Reichenbachiella faecimaris]|uniref:Por secretion system C-terminal sorting domain-containing protein n=1 Tax=Reichenbachiella faecimaris TaxID=692418 RepID=A0A1W2GJ09_REIFA|nr:Vps62-related protein [Reichenbachiella faecimaris]SMD36645.1 Por secretion system C-terminal sorting domain-containing protein [Reichenbachiella faecimaris]
MHLFYRPTLSTQGLVCLVCILFSCVVFANELPCGQRRLFKDGTELTSTYDAAYHYIEDGSITMKDGFVAKPGFSIKPSLDCSQTRPALEELVRKYAPRVIYSSKEDYHISSVDWYLERSYLGYFRSITDYDIVCPDASNCDLKNGNSENYRLIGNGSTKYGAFDNAKIYVNVQMAYYQSEPYLEDDIEIQYWFFNPWNGDQGSFELASHQGDWEAVKVIISNEGKLKWIFASAHGNWHMYYKNELGFEGDHPILYAANESHAFYSNGGYNHPVVPRKDHCGGGPNLDTWEIGRYEIIEIDDQLRNHAIEASNPDWMYFMGRWGGTFSGTSLASQSPITPRKNYDQWLGKKPLVYVIDEGLGFRWIPFDYTKKGILPLNLVTGSSTLCYGSDKSYAIDVNKPYTAKWSATDRMSTRSGLGSSFTTQMASSINSGSGTISADITVQYPKGYDINYGAITKYVWLGEPTGGAFNMSEHYPQSSEGSANEDHLTQEDQMSTTDPTPNCGNTIISLSYAGGFTPTSVIWSNTGNFTLNNESLSSVSLIANEAGEIAGSLNVTVFNVCGGSYSTGWYINYFCGEEEPLMARIRESEESESGLLNAQLLTNYQLYPNPTTGEVRIGLVSNGEEFTNIRAEVFDFSGKVVEVFIVDELEGSIFNLDLSAQEKGLYMVRVFQEEAPVFESKIVKK